MKGAVDYLLELIRIPSVSSLSNRPILNCARAALQGAGWRATELVHWDESGLEKANLIAAPAAQDPAAGDVDLVFVCHTDTVPYSPDWAEAIRPVVAEGVVYGCGACDVKGFLACLLSAVSQVPTNTIMRQVRIVLTADEETGCQGAQRLLAAGWPHATQMVVGEPTSLAPARAGKGYCLARVTVLGAEAHSAHPQQGRSAIFDAARLIGEIEALGQRMTARQNSFFTPAWTTLNVGTIAGGSAKNIVPGHCSFLLEWRPIPGEDIAAVPEMLHQIIRSMQQQRPDFRCDVEVLRQQSGFETGASATLVQTLVTLSGRSPVAIPFGSEASVLGGMAQEVVVWGPGDMRTAHSSRECVPIAELEEAARCIRALLQA